MANNTKYVKLTAKPNTWFKENSEVWHYFEPRRMTLEEWEECMDFCVCVRGIRIVQLEYELPLNYKMGDERIDGECCSCDEFTVEITEEKGAFEK